MSKFAIFSALLSHLPSPVPSKRENKRDTGMRRYSGRKSAYLIAAVDKIVEKNYNKEKERCTVNKRLIFLLAISQRNSRINFEFVAAIFFAVFSRIG